MTQQFIVTTPGSGTTAPAAGTIINANFAELYAGIQYVSVKSFGAKVDGIALYDAASTTGTTSTITSASAAFSSADVGKVCALNSATEIATVVHGTITAYNNSGSVVCTFSSSPGSLTGATFVYGTDDSSAFTNAAAAAKLTGATLFVPQGILCATYPLIVPEFVRVVGVGYMRTIRPAHYFKHIGSSIVALSSANGLGSTALLTLGDNSASSSTGTLASGLNIDAFNLAGAAVQTVGFASAIERCCALRANGTWGSNPNVVYANAGTSLISDCVVISGNNSNGIACGGDSKVLDNLVFGAGNGFYGVHMIGGGGDLLIRGNHIWKNAVDNTLLGGGVYLSFFATSGGAAGGVTIQGNQFDTAFGPQVEINLLSEGSPVIVRGISVLDNTSMTNDITPNNTYPWLQLTVAATNVLRGLVVSNNIVRGSWNTPTLGGPSYFIDGSGVAGAVYGSIVTGNFIDNLGTGAYNSFTPTLSANNAYMGAPSSNTVTTF